MTRPRRWFETLGEWRCWLTGHEYTTTASAQILRRACIHCGRETPGWCTDTPAYRVTQPADPARLRLAPREKVAQFPRRVPRGKVARS